MQEYCLEEVFSIVEETVGVTSAKVFFQPPNNGIERKEDSGNKNFWETINNICGKQLQSSAKPEVTTVVNKDGSSTFVQETVGVFDTEKFFLVSKQEKEKAVDRRQRY